jgi:hypothetical protein
VDPSVSTNWGVDSRAATAAAYAILGAVLLWSRLADLGKGFWFDESTFVSHFVRKGPREIIAGPDLSHELYGVLAWTTGALIGESEFAYRLLSTVPFIAGVVLVTAWLHARVNPGSGLLFLFLATVSPLLLDITRQARGYGLAFLAMSVLIVSALEANRTGRTLPVAAMCVSGVVGTWTLPQLSIGFLATGAVLATDRVLRRPAIVGLALSMAAIGAWYAPHIGQIHAASQIEDGRQISTVWLVSGPIDQVLLPALLFIEGTVLIPGVIWLPLLLLSAVVIGSSPLVRERGSALILGLGPIATILVLWIGQAYIIPRYLSFLLVPLFMFLASGASSILARLTRRQATLRSVACVVAICALAFNFAAIAPDVVRLPKEATRDAAEIIETRSAPTTPVLTRLSLPEGLVFYLGRPVHALRSSEVVARVCGSHVAVAYVTQSFSLPAVAVPCLDRSGVRHFRFKQYTRGDEMNVWFVPPRS